MPYLWEGWEHFHRKITAATLNTVIHKLLKDVLFIRFHLETFSLYYYIGEQMQFYKGIISSYINAQFYGNYF